MRLLWPVHAMVYPVCVNVIFVPYKTWSRVMPTYFVFDKGGFCDESLLGMGGELTLPGNTKPVEQPFQGLWRGYPWIHV